MDWQFTAYAAPLFVGTLVMLGITALGWQRRAVRGAKIISLLTFMVAIYTLGYALELGSQTLADAQFWLRIEYIGIVTSSVLLLALILAYVGLDRFLTPLNGIAALIIPAITLVLAWTNSQHEWIWQDMILKPAGSRYMVDFTPGGWYWVSVGYTWVLLTCGAVILIRAYRRAVGVFKRQIGIILAGALIPFVFHITYISGVFPVELDINPYALTIVSLTLAWGIFDYSFLDIMPIARQTVFASMTDSVIVLDARDRVIDLNPLAAELARLSDGTNCMGCPAAEVFPNWFAAAITPEDRHKRAELELTLNGDKRYFDLRLSPLYGRAGRYEGRLIALNDITERKAAEQERERLLAELDAFAHTVAHDLRTPLTALIGYSSILEAGLEQLPPSEIKRFAHAIGRSSRKMTDIIEALLLLASVRQMDQVQVVPLDMAAIVAEVHHRLSEVTTEYRAQITGPEAWPVALGYAPWIEEVWTNYLINAIKYGGTPPCVELGAAILPDGMIRFWVRDNGYGLTLDQQGQLFVPFARLHQVKAKGYGLGLSIVKRIVEKMGGQVSITSEIGQGSEFSFTLPPAPPNGQG